MARPKFRITCCLCRKSIPQASDVYALDIEWQRRFPKMTGTLACANCAVHNNHWTCHAPSGAFVAGHQPAAREPGDCIDSWSHIEEHGTHVAMVLIHPWSGLLQGAEEYLRYTVRRPGINRDTAQRVQDALDRWDAQARSASTRQSNT